MPLTDREREITKAVVHEFLTLNKSTSHRLLVRQFKDPDGLQRLVTAAILNPIGHRGRYLPRLLAFHYCGDTEALNQAKTGTTMVLHVLKNLSEVEWEKETFTRADVELQAKKMYDALPFNDAIKLGLYLVPEFSNVLSSCGFSDPEATELTTLQLHDNIVTLTDVEGAWDENVRRCSVYLEGGPEQIESEQEATMEAAHSTLMAINTDHRGPLVFISHSSKDTELALALIELLKSALGLLADQIRCTSVDGYRLPVGVKTEDKLREEVNAATVVIGLITPASLLSYYVMFELGARWGANLFLAPLLAGVKPSELSGPLSLLNALVADKEEQLHQLLRDVSLRLGLQLQNTASYLRHISPIKALADSIPTHVNAKYPPALPVSVEFDPFSGQSEQMFLTVTNRGAKQNFRAQCRILERRNDPNLQRKMTFDLHWQHGGKDKHLVPGEAGNLLIASAGEDKLHGLEWMKLEASGHHGPESKWGSDEKKRPEYDLEIVVLGDKSDQPQSERFTLRAGSTCALEMYRRYVRIDSPVNQAVVNQRKCRVQGSVGIPHARVQLFVYVGGQWHQNGDATVRGNSWEGICWFGDKDATRGEYRIRAIADGDLEPIKYKELPNNGVRSEDISVHLKREKTP